MNKFFTHTQQPPARRKLSGIHVLMATSLITILFLAYIDEGYYSFQWMTDAGNWIAIVLFTSVLFLLQWGVYALAMKVFDLRDTIAHSFLISALAILVIVPAMIMMIPLIIDLFLA